jgi:hypothetical protein
MRHMKWAIGLLLTAILASSCATTVHVRHLVPAEVNLAGRRELAVSTATLPDSIRRPSPWIDGLQETNFSLYSGWEGDIPTTVTTLATNHITKELSSTGYFTVLGPRQTDGYMAQICGGKDGCSGLTALGVRALMVLDIPYMEATEQVIGRDHYEQMTKELELENPDKGKPLQPDTIKITNTFNELKGRDYYLVQKATLTLTYTLYDTGDGTVIASRTFTDSSERETKIGTRTYGADLKTYSDERTYYSNLAPSFAPLFDSIVESMGEKIALQLAPSWKSSRVSLLDVKPKSESVKEAEKAVKHGEYQQAYLIYYGLWQQHSFAAGYNAALLLEGMGKLDEALALMDDVYHQSGSQHSHAALLRIQEAKSLHDKAERQITGEIDDDGQGLLLTQYMVAE